MHFLTIVLCPYQGGEITPQTFVDPAAREQIENQVDALMAPFSEHLRVPEYERPCSECIVWKKANQAQKMAEQAPEGEAFDRAYNENMRLMEKAFEEHVSEQEFEDVWSKPYRDAFHARVRRTMEILESLPDPDPDPKCLWCNGTGVERTSGNPQAHWDGFSIGGRWTGVVGEIFDEQFKAEAKPLIEEAKRTQDREPILRWFEEADLRRNVCLVRGLNPRLRPYACVTPDGAWHGEGSLGHMQPGEVYDYLWPDVWAEIKAQYPDALAVGVDCHI